MTAYPHEVSTAKRIIDWAKASMKRHRSLYPECRRVSRQQYPSVPGSGDVNDNSDNSDVSEERPTGSITLPDNSRYISNPQD